MDIVRLADFDWLRFWDTRILLKHKSCLLKVKCICRCVEDSFVWTPVEWSCSALFFNCSMTFNKQKSYLMQSQVNYVTAGCTAPSAQVCITHQTNVATRHTRVKSYPCTVFVRNEDVWARIQNLFAELMEYITLWHLPLHSHACCHCELLLLVLPWGASIDQRGISLIRAELRRKEKEGGRKRQGRGRKETSRIKKGEENAKRQLDLLLCDGLGRDRADEGTTKGMRARGRSGGEERGVNKHANWERSIETEMRCRCGSLWMHQSSLRKRAQTKAEGDLIPFWAAQCSRDSIIFFLTTSTSSSLFWPHYSTSVSCVCCFTACIINAEGWTLSFKAPHISMSAFLVTALDNSICAPVV